MLIWLWSGEAKANWQEVCSVAACAVPVPPPAFFHRWGRSLSTDAETKKPDVVGQWVPPSFRGSFSLFSIYTHQEQLSSSQESALLHSPSQDSPRSVNTEEGKRGESSNSC